MEQLELPGRPVGHLTKLRITAAIETFVSSRPPPPLYRGRARNVHITPVPLAQFNDVLEGERGELGDSATRVVIAALEKKAAASRTRTGQTNPPPQSGIAASRKIHPEGRADCGLESVGSIDEVKAFSADD